MLFITIQNPIITLLVVEFPRSLAGKESEMLAARGLIYTIGNFFCDSRNRNSVRNDLEYVASVKIGSLCVTLNLVRLAFHLRIDLF